MGIHRSNQFDYLDGQLRPGQAAWFEQIAAANDRDVAEVNYPLSPEMSVGDIVVAARASLGRLAALTEGVPLILIGHSAGAQIAVEIGMNPPNEGERVAGILAISGIFDLAPLIDTSLNQKLGLDMAAAHA